jgi:hypothetical protein
MTATVSRTFNEFTFMALFDPYDPYYNTNTMQVWLDNISSSQITKDGATLNEQGTNTFDVFDCLENKKIGSICFNIDTAATTENNFTVANHNALTALRYLAKSNFTNLTNRFININRQLADFRLFSGAFKSGVKIIDAYFRVVTAQNYEDLHFHKKLSATQLDAEVDSN